MFGVWAKFDKLAKLESFQTNFNKLVNAGGRISKYVFQFNMPVEYLESLKQPEYDD
jgi:hypothetical protein